MKRVTFNAAMLIAAACAFAVGVTGAQSSKSKDGQSGAVVGYVTALSGPGSLFGQASLQAAKLAVEEVNASGGVLGGQLKLRVADDRSDPRIARQVWKKLVDSGVAAMLFRENSAIRVAVLPIAEEANIPAIYANLYEGGACSPVLYVTAEIAPMKIKPYLTFLKSKGGSKLFFLGTDYNWARTVLNLVKEAAPTLGIEVVGAEFTPFNTSSYLSIISKIRDSGADLLLAALVGGPDNVAFYKQARSRGLMQSLDAIGNLALDDTTLAAVGGAAEGTYMVGSYFWTLDTAANKEFRQALKGKFGNEMLPQGFLSEPAYDAVHLYALAVNKAGTTETSQVLKALSEVKFSGPKGTIHLTEDRHGAMPIYVAQANADGTYEVVKSLGVETPPDQCPAMPFGMSEE